MTHRTVNMDGIKIDVFETSLGAEKWLKREKADCIVVVRGKSYFMRKDGKEITVRLGATVCKENMHILSAANTVADEVERLLEKAAA
jgi:hypothetical protein